LAAGIDREYRSRGGQRALTAPLASVSGAWCVPDRTAGRRAHRWPFTAPKHVNSVANAVPPEGAAFGFQWAGPSSSAALLQAQSSACQGRPH
jgi:hypothetical protein